MAAEMLKSARAVAVEVLDRCDPERSFAAAILDKMQHQTGQRQRATDLVFGTLRNRTAIDTVIATFSGRPVKRIQPRLLNIIRVGTYELVYCPSAEQYAVVNEAVAAARAAGSARQAGFVNAVLRQIARRIIDRQSPLSQADPQRTLPQQLSTGCQFDTSFLPDRRKSPAEYLSTVFSLPEWLAAGWLDEFGEETAGFVCLASNRRPSVYIRPNTLKTTAGALAEKLAAAGISLDIVPDLEMIRIKSPREITVLPGFADGEFTVQDITASMPVRMLIRSAFGVRRSPQVHRTPYGGVPRIATQNAVPGTQHETTAARSTQHAARTLLDLCAAPGTKTTQLAEATGDLPREMGRNVISPGQAKIIATDIDARRLEMVRENIARLGISSVDVVPYEELLVVSSAFGVPRHAVRSTQHEKFDCILLDVPCSNTGVLAKRVEARYRIEPEKIRELAKTQAGLLDVAAKLIAPGGKICYSTCSIQKEENSQIVQKFLRENKYFTLESQQLTLPEAKGFDRDGGYVAVIVKKSNQ